MFVRNIQFTVPLTGIHADAGAVGTDTREIHETNKQSETEKTRQELVALGRRKLAVLDSIQQSLQTIETQQRDARTNIGQVALELAMLVAENVVRRAVNANDYDIATVVEQALKRLPGSDAITIYLHPLDKQLLNEQLTIGQSSEGELDQPFETRPAHIAFLSHNVRADPNLNRGDCYVDAGSIGMLTTVDQHLTDLRQWLLEGLDDEITDDEITTTDDVTSQGDGSPNSIVRRLSNRGNTDERSGNPVG